MGTHEASTERSSAALRVRRVRPEACVFANVASGLAPSAAEQVMPWGAF